MKENRFLKDAQRVTKIMAIQRQNDVIAMLLEGKEQAEIQTYLMGKYHISLSMASQTITQARKAIAARKNFEVDNLITMHIARYEFIYTKLYEMRAFINATTALQRKERLMGFHREGFHMKVSNAEISAISLQRINDEYDVMKLDKEKRERLEELINKSARQAK